jgi:coenzyme F420-reducing hydrogenase delta subunit
VDHTRRLLEAIGLEGERLQMRQLSSAMGQQFADEAAALTETIRRLGPSPLRPTGAPASGPVEAPGRQEESRS